MRLLREGGSSWGFVLVLGILWLAPPSLLCTIFPFPFLLHPALEEHPQLAGSWLGSCPALGSSWVLLAVSA